MSFLERIDLAIRLDRSVAALWLLPHFAFRRRHELQAARLLATAARTPRGVLLAHFARTPRRTRCSLSRPTAARAGSRLHAAWLMLPLKASGFARKSAIIVRWIAWWSPPRDRAWRCRTACRHAKPGKVDSPEAGAAALRCPVPELPARQASGSVRRRAWWSALRPARLPAVAGRAASPADRAAPCIRAASARAASSRRSGTKRMAR